MNPRGSGNFDVGLWLVLLCIAAGVVLIAAGRTEAGFLCCLAPFVLDVGLRRRSR